MRSIEVKEAVIETCLPDIVHAAQILIDCFKNGKKILLCGNGGSATDVAVKIPSNETQHIQESHIAVRHLLCELVETDFFKKNS